jgi:uncharacterized protein
MHTVAHDILLFLVGTFSSICGSIVGLGGAFITIPFLLWLTDLKVEMVAGTSMAVLLMNSLSSVAKMSKQKRVDFKSGFLFSVAMIPGSIAGAAFSHLLSGKTYYMVFGAFLICVSLLVLAKPEKPLGRFLKPTIEREIGGAGEETYRYSYNLAFALTVSLLTGFVSSLLGIGGGSVLVPMMVLFCFFPPHVATATSMFAIMLSSLIGAATHVWLGDVDWRLFPFLAAGAITGGQIGSRVSSKMKGKTILRLLSACLIFVALRLMWKGVS